MSILAREVDAQEYPSWIKDAVAGCAATAPMTVFMLFTQRFLPHGQRYELPPEIIIQDLARRAHLHWRLSKRQILLATLVSHLGYGAAMGLFYRPIERSMLGPSLVKGSGFGLLVWAASYLGLLPAMGLVESAYREPGRRNLMMIAAHLVWGSATGFFASLFTRRRAVGAAQGNGGCAGG